MAEPPVWSVYRGCAVAVYTCAHICRERERDTEIQREKKSVFPVYIEWCNPLSGQCTRSFVRTWGECICVYLCTLVHTKSLVH